MGGRADRDAAAATLPHLAAVVPDAHRRRCCRGAGGGGANRAACLAVLAAEHPRAGAGSPLRRLPFELLRALLHLAGGPGLDQFCFAAVLCVETSTPASPASPVAREEVFVFGCSDAEGITPVPIRTLSVGQARVAAGTGGCCCGCCSVGVLYTAGAGSVNRETLRSATPVYRYLPTPGVAYAGGEVPATTAVSGAEAIVSLAVDVGCGVLVTLSQSHLRCFDLHTDMCTGMRPLKVLPAGEQRMLVPGSGCRSHALLQYTTNAAYNPQHPSSVIEVWRLPTPEQPRPQLHVLKKQRKPAKFKNITRRNFRNCGACLAVRGELLICCTGGTRSNLVYGTSTIQMSVYSIPTIGIITDRVRAGSLLSTPPKKNKQTKQNKKQNKNKSKKTTNKSKKQTNNNNKQTKPNTHTHAINTLTQMQFFSSYQNGPVYCVTHMCMSPSQQFLMVGCVQGAVSMLDASLNALWDNRLSHAGAVGATVVSSRIADVCVGDTGLGVSAGTDGTVKGYDRRGCATWSVPCGGGTRALLLLEPFHSAKPSSVAACTCSCCAYRRERLAAAAKRRGSKG
eukprot:TRINITY_DN9693_c0_g1_i1.p1 TRINITY_DN9693_c0_g1~~TRINITY_DN9693_c0_g1_i1.p1  ORF type:complete len:566 (-),score=126.39 TRINITY_DN9693_c0_g1_i1:77-1774(-)